MRDEWGDFMSHFISSLEQSSGHHTRLMEILNDESLTMSRITKEAIIQAISPNPSYENEGLETIIEGLDFQYLQGMLLGLVMSLDIVQNKQAFTTPMSAEQKDLINLYTAVEAILIEKIGGEL
tara:strand:+ start:1648 stop:2016 length:369 start_codon:yes stop_codon:yes gene_type:complete